MEREHSSLRSSQIKSDSTLIDLQCRSMRDNLVFTGIEEVTLKEYEDVQKSLNTFLEYEIGIYEQIEFHRVHRIGAYDKDTAKESPRPIIAKFEKFKAREYVKSRARDTLKGKPFGIREQFPKVIEQKRKALYPIAKEARKNPDNKVRLVRDRLFVNEEEIVVAPNEAIEHRSDNPPRRQDTRSQTQRPWQNTNSDRSYRGERVFYRSGKGARKHYKETRTSDKTKSVNFQVPISNPFGPLAKWGSDTPIRQNMGNASASKKHPASSPLDDDYTTKNHREDSDSDTSVQDTEMQSPPRTGLAEQNAQSNSANDNPKDCSIVPDLEIKNNDQNVNSKISETGDLVKPNIAEPSLVATGSKSTDGGSSECNLGANENSAHDSENPNGDDSSDTQ